MIHSDIRTWQGVHTEVLRRINARQWKPGDLIPNEVDLAQEFGVARATVNRALRTLSEAGVLDRRRKAGTRVALHPVSKATLDIPVIRFEVEGRRQKYGYGLLSQVSEPLPAGISAAMGAKAGDKYLHVRALHTADSAPYVVEDRWINPAAMAGTSGAVFEQTSANEWLLQNAPYTHGDISFSAANASVEEAELFGVATGAAVFVTNRTTWDGDVAITSVRLAYAPGYRMNTTI